MFTNSLAYAETWSTFTNKDIIHASIDEVVPRWLHADRTIEAQDYFLKLDVNDLLFSKSTLENECLPKANSLTVTAGSSLTRLR